MIESSPENIDEIRTEAPKPIAPSSFIRNSTVSQKTETDVRNSLRATPVKKEEINKISTSKTLSSTKKASAKKKVVPPNSSPKKESQLPKHIQKFIGREQASPNK
jgi:hypothetical protein